MPEYITWLALGFMLLIAELVTGTFYLLMVAIGFAAGSLAALAGAGSEVQYAIGAVVGFAAMGALYVVRRRHRGQPVASESNPDIVIDIGASVEVQNWDDGRARVRYRGADWDAVPEMNESPAT